ncbi:dTMP kinase [Pacificispira sp.]|uniref:dTMP kinase n=1 Tax=Pacificispira sp. TaxID=2888761 RepID=UPI003BAC5D24
MAPRGRFITFEGGEGTGKTTQVGRLADCLAQSGIECVVTREPGGTDGAQAIRELVVSGAGDRWGPVSEALLMYAARRDHVDRVIKPSLASGKWVLCDRFSDSTLAYQGYARGLGAAWVRELDRLSLDGFKPDLTLLLDLPVSEGLLRASARGGPDRFELLGHQFHEDLRRAFLDIAATDPDRVVTLSAEGSVDAVAERVKDTVRSRFALTGPA